MELKGVKLVFLVKTNSLILLNKGDFVIIKLPKILLARSQNGFNLFSVNFFSVLNSVYNKLSIFMNNLNKIVFSEVNLIGIGYRLRKITDGLYRIFLGRANYVYVNTLPEIVVKVYSREKTKVRKVLVFGANIMKVHNFISFLLLLKPLNPYRVAGVVDVNKVIILKSGKQR